MSEVANETEIGSGKGIGSGRGTVSVSEIGTGSETGSATGTGVSVIRIEPAVRHLGEAGPHHHATFVIETNNLSVSMRKGRGTDPAMAVLPPPVLPRQTRLLPALLLREEVSAEEEAVPAVTGILEGVGEGITTIAMALYAVGLRKVAGVETEMIVIGVIGMATSTRVEIATIVTCEIESPGLKSIAAPFRTSNHRRLKTSLRLQSHHPRQHLAPYLRATQVYRRLKPSEESENHHQQDRERCLSDRSLRVAANLKVLRPLNLNPFISQMQVLLYQLARELNQIPLRDHQANNGSIQVLQAERSQSRLRR